MSSKKVAGAIKTIDLASQRFKVHSPSERIIEGYFSTRDLDRGGDISLPSAFAKTMDMYMKNPVITYMHDVKKVMGKVLEYKIDEVGVWIRGQIAKGVEWIDDTWKLMEQGMLKGFSYGYDTIDEEPGQHDGKEVNFLKEVDLFEVAVVSVPMNGAALFTLSSGAVKAVSLNLADFKSVEELFTHKKEAEKKEEVKTEEVKTGEVKTEEVKTEEVKTPDKIDFEEISKKFIELLMKSFDENKESIKSLMKDAIKEVLIDREEEASRVKTWKEITDITKELQSVVKLYSKKED